MTTLRNTCERGPRARIAAFSLRATLFAVGLLPALISQTLPQISAASTPAGGEVIELSPFTVNTTSDVGYRAENTLAGSRLNTKLRDTPASISVFTKEFLDDLGITDIAQLVD